MKPVLATLGCLMVAAPAVIGQGVSISLAQDQEQYLPGEVLMIKVRISNDSGRTVQFGTDPGWLTLSVENSKHYLVERLGTVPVLGAFSLDSGTLGIKRVDIAPYFDLTQPGRYFVKASLNLAQWGEAIQSKALSFDIIKGNNIWEKEFGVPPREHQTNSVPEVRRYALVETLHSNVPRLYFRLTDLQDVKVFSIFSLGPMVSFGNLDAQLDRFSNLHVLFQSGGRTFIHALMNPDGLIIARETYEPVESRPSLRAQTDGRIIVTGGVRRFSPTDLPPPVRAPLDAKSDQP
jgi:hypothetical protein